MQKKQTINEIKSLNLKRIRLLHKLKQHEIADMINMRESNVSDMENNRRSITDKVIDQLCNKLNIQPYEFVINEKTPIIINEKERLHIQKFREAEQLQVDNEVSLITQWVIEKASNEKPENNPDKSKKKPRKIQGKEV